MHVIQRRSDLHIKAYTVKIWIKLWLQRWKYNAVLRDAELQIVQYTRTAIPQEQQCEAHVWCSSGGREWSKKERKRVWLIMWAMGACESCRKLLHRRPLGTYLVPTDSNPCCCYNKHNWSECLLPKALSHGSCKKENCSFFRFGLHR